MMRTSIALAVVMAASAARAQPAPDGAGAPGEPPPAPAPVAAPVPAPPPEVAKPTTVDLGVLEDANSGRTWVSPTALTSPAGTWSFSDYELLVVGVGFSPTDQIDLSASTLIPLGGGVPFVGALTGKVQLVKSGSVRIAAHAMFGFSTSTSSTNSTGTTTNTNGGGVGTVGGVATLCLDPACHSHASGYVGLGFATAGQTSVPLLLSGSIAGRVGRHVKLIGEVDSGALLGGAYGGFASGLALWYGVRFTSHNIGVDLGFLEPIIKTSTTTFDPMTMMSTTSSSWSFGIDNGKTLPMGVPFVSFTYRT